MSTTFNKNPVIHGNFRVEIDGIPVATFKECSEREFPRPVAETREGTDPQWPQKYEGRPKFPNFTLKKLVREGYASDNKDFLDWVKAGSSDRRSISVVDLDFQGNEVDRTNHYRAWCCNSKKGAHDATNESDPIIDEFEIAYDYGGRA